VQGGMRKPGGSPAYRVREGWLLLLLLLRRRRWRQLSLQGASACERTQVVCVHAPIYVCVCMCVSVCHVQGRAARAGFKQNTLYMCV